MFSKSNKTPARSPAPDLQALAQRKAQLECKVELLAAMVAMKDECLRASDERARPRSPLEEDAPGARAASPGRPPQVQALKWEVLNNFHGDEAALDALGDALRARCHGWAGDAPDGTRTIAHLVVDREAAVQRKLAGVVPAARFAEGLAEVLPEFRRDFLHAVARNFGAEVDVAAFLAQCRAAYVEVLTAQARAASGSAVGQAAHAALAARAPRGGVLQEEGLGE
mmetsp:Transcript_13476/g.40116  ORF Transcript_13476/g.40116 Transcript_13476/m.40116 type:complete len:225 (+) Transcript_13476:160-834(+)